MPTKRLSRRWRKKDRDAAGGGGRGGVGRRQCRGSEYAGAVEPVEPEVTEAAKGGLERQLLRRRLER
jgi:hypothetical protein